MQAFRHKDLIAIEDLDSSDLKQIFEFTQSQKKQIQTDGQNQALLAGKILGMIFEKASLRTRVSFEVGMLKLGGQAIYLDQTNFKLGERESIFDIAKNMERFVDILMLRTYSHQAIREMARHTKLPVINGLSDHEHPCQALADLFTLREKVGSLQGLKLAYLGDGNNVATSLAYASALSGIEFVAVSPPGYLLPDQVVSRARELAQEGARISVSSDLEALDGADCLYTDVWASMGQEAEKEKRAQEFKAYQLNDQALARAKPTCLVMHCLPAHRGEEISASVIDGPNSVVFDQAENRMHVQKAVLCLLMGHF